MRVGVVPHTARASFPVKVRNNAPPKRGSWSQEILDGHENAAERAVAPMHPRRRAADRLACRCASSQPGRGRGERGGAPNTRYRFRVRSRRAPPACTSRPRQQKAQTQPELGRSSDRHSVPVGSVQNFVVRCMRGAGSVARRCVRRCAANAPPAHSPRRARSRSSRPMAFATPRSEFERPTSRTVGTHEASSQCRASPRGGLAIANTPSTQSSSASRRTTDTGAARASRSVPERPGISHGASPRSADRGRSRRSGSASDTSPHKRSARPPRGQRGAPVDDARVSGGSPAHGRGRRPTSGPWAHSLPTTAAVRGRAPAGHHHGEWSLDVKAGRPRRPMNDRRCAGGQVWTLRSD